MGLTGKPGLLVAEDEAGIRDLLAEGLGRAYRVQTAADGEKGMRAYRANRGGFCAVVTDVIMPNMDGIELYHAIRKEGGMQPVIFMTGFEGENGMGLQLILNADSATGFFRKPVRIQDLIEMVCTLTAEYEASKGINTPCLEAALKNA